MKWYPHRMPSWLDWAYPGVEWFGPKKERHVYLTFDDGPHPSITPWVMDRLEEFGFLGTFFMIGDNAIAYPDVMRQVLERGHAIGNHTQHHVPIHKTSLSQYLNAIDLADQHLPPTELFRPPHGRMRRRAISKIDKRIIMWSLLSGDFDANLNLEKALKAIKSGTRPGSIIVFHDSDKAERNLRSMLPDYLTFLKQEKYSCPSL